MMKSRIAAFAFAMALTAPNMAAAEPDSNTEKTESASEAPATETEPVSAAPPPSLMLLYVAPDRGKPVKGSIISSSSLSR